MGIYFMKICENVVYGLKVIAGKQLTKWKRANADPPEECRYDGRFEGPPKSKPRNSIRMLESGDFLRVRQVSECIATPDASEGWNRIHVGYLPLLIVRFTYDLKGRLTEKRVSRSSDRGISMHDSPARYFDPPGRWWGKRVR